LIKASLGVPKVFGDFLDALFPELARRMHRSTLRRHHEHFVEADLREHITDLLFSVQVDKEPVHPYLLFEHRSDPRRFARLDVGRYVGQVYQYLPEEWRSPRAAAAPAGGGPHCSVRGRAALEPFHAVFRDDLHPGRPGALCAAL
jgi:hypothetical protein